MLKKQLLRTSPFFILSIMLALVMLYTLVVERGGPDGFGYLAVLSLLPYFMAMIILDVVLKLVFKTTVKWIWIIESFLSLGFLYYWIVK